LPEVDGGRQRPIFPEKPADDRESDLCHHYAMARLRLFLTDRLNGGILAVLLVYALLFQSAAGSVASACVAETRSHAPGIIFSESGHAHKGHDPASASHASCAVLCQIACGLGASLHPDAHGMDLGPAHAAYLASTAFGEPDRLSPRHRGIRRDARAPPHFSA